MTDTADTQATRIICEDSRAIAQRVPVTKLHVSTPDAPSMSAEISSSVVRVGSAEQGNDVVISDDTVSRFHFEIVWDERGPRIRDLESTNGTFVDGYQVKDMYLHSGSVIHAGRAQLTFEALGEEVEERLFGEDRFGPLVGRSTSMRRLFAVLDNVAPTDATVLVEGETGTGKELVARALHERSARAGGPFVVVDCASMPSGMLQSELFGHKRGAFTGAVADRAGQVVQANGGTLFLDEIGELPIELQPNLLRVLESREVRMLGDGGTTAVDIRVLAATNRDLAREVNRGTFREDLYYRLSVVRLCIPPLRDRREDIPLLVEHLVRQTLRNDPGRADQVLSRFSPTMLESLKVHPWPGNVRELRNAVERTLALGPSRGQEFGVSDVQAHAKGDSPTTPRTDGAYTLDLDATIDLDRPLVEQRSELLERFEKSYLTAMVARHDGKIAPAARAAGIDRAYFRRLLKKYRT